MAADGAVAGAGVGVAVKHADVNFGVVDRGGCPQHLWRIAFSSILIDREEEKETLWIGRRK